jgi:hypothetical protein
MQRLIAGLRVDLVWIGGGKRGGDRSCGGGDAIRALSVWGSICSSALDLEGIYL